MLLCEPNCSWKQDHSKFISELTSLEAQEKWMWDMYMLFASSLMPAPPQ